VTVTDCHVHINPVWEMLPAARALMERDRRGLRDLEPYLREPSRFLAYLDQAQVDRAVLVNYVSPEVVGYTERSNDFVLDYVRGHEDRLVAVGSVHPRLHPDPRRGVRELKERGIRGIKLHPPHQWFHPNAYRPEEGGDGRLAGLYDACQEHGLPVILHTGTSIFPGARDKYAEPLQVEDVALDYPDLTIVLAHGGRPLWMGQAQYLCRRFPNVYLEVSSVPPTKLLDYFPDLARLSPRVLFGSDWPGPGVKDLGENLRQFRALPLDPEVLHQILEVNPMRVFPA
jgi:predicted TIM-barrel fold metal-dependent hydrolase